MVGGMGGGSNETARIHHASRRCGRRLAARGARAADAEAAGHRVLDPDDGFGCEPAGRRFRRAAARSRLDRGPRRRDQGSMGGGAERARSRDRRRVRLKVDIVVSKGTASVPAAREATSVIPMVFAGGDPVGTGLVVTLARPGGDVTGVSLEQTDLAGKRLERLHELVPALRRLAILGNAGNPVTLRDLRAVEAAAGAPGLPWSRWRFGAWRIWLPVSRR